MTRVPSSGCSHTNTPGAGLVITVYSRAENAGEGKRRVRKVCKEEKNSFGRKHSHMQPVEHCDLDYFWNLMFLMFKRRK